jgi:hypothetical protein
MSATSKPASDFFWGAISISRAASISLEECLRRIEAGELPVERAGSLVFIDKATLARITASAHWRRHESRAA